MAQQLDNEGMDTGSNYGFQDKMIRPNYPRSMFDLSHLVARDIPQAGLVFPISLIEALPASDYEISVKHLIRVMPQVVPLMSRQRIYIYAFYSRCADLWCDFDVFIRKGYSGNEVMQVPQLSGKNNMSKAKSGETYSTPSNLNFPYSLGDFLGLPIASYSDSQASYPTNVMPFMMYLRIWRDYFLNRNYYVDDRRILPNDDSRFRLNSDGQVASFVDAGNDIECLFDVRGWNTCRISDDTPRKWIPSKGMTYISDTVFSVSPFYHDYPADYFTSALPWPQRGNTPTLEFDASLSNLSTNLTFGSDTNLFVPGSLGGSASLRAMFTSADTFGLQLLQNRSSVIDSSVVVGAANTHFNDWLNAKLATGKVSSSASASGNFSITLENLRELAISQTIMEKMARTDGSYREFGLTFFGEPSKSAMDYRPTFIGGTTSSIAFTEVLQTSASTESSALGQFAGHGISANGQQDPGYIGRVHCDDYGYIMILACIMPDVYYSQGMEKMWSRVNQSDWFLPERAQLGMQPIYNRELYLASHGTLDSEGNVQNDMLWAYQDIYDEYRYRPNRIGGQLAMPERNSFFPYTQSRVFDKLPVWGQEFARADDVRTDYLSGGNNESAYVGQFDINIRAVQPLPYRARPATILNGL